MSHRRTYLHEPNVVLGPGPAPRTRRGTVRCHRPIRTPRIEDLQIEFDGHRKPRKEKRARRQREWRDVVSPMDAYGRVNPRPSLIWQLLDRCTQTRVKVYTFLSRRDLDAAVNAHIRWKRMRKGLL